MSTTTREHGSHNYQGVDLYTGKVFFSQKPTALYKPGTTHRSKIAKHGSIIKARIPDRFGRYFNVEASLDKYYYCSLADNDWWNKPVPYSVLYHDGGYRGPLPKEGEILVVTKYLMRVAEHQPHFEEVHYQYKHIKKITEEERHLSNEPLVEPDYATVYEDEERCPEVPAEPRFKDLLAMLYNLQERWEFLSRLEEAGELEEEDDEDDDHCNEDFDYEEDNN